MPKLNHKNKIKLLFVLIIFLASFLRIFQVNKFPPSLYWEEVALGFDAYSILKTANDHHGNFLPLVAFESFGDWKPSLYFYAIVPFIGVLGLTELAIRLPAILSGVAIVIGIGVLASQISGKKRVARFSLIAMLIASISPWAIQFSRSAWEVNLATALILWGVILFLKFSQKQQIKFLLGSVFLFSLSMYAYHAARIISPLLGLSLAALWLFDGKKTYLNIKNNLSKIIMAGLLSLVLISPIILSLNNSKTTQRFKETSIFYNLDIIKESNSRVENNNLISKAFYHRYVLFSREITKNIFSYFDISFLFLNGDQNPRHSLQYFGTFYHIEFLFLIFGAYYLFKNWNKYHAFLLFWLIVGLIPASISKTNPHALRILPTLPVWILLISFGISQLVNNFNKKIISKLVVLIIILAYLLELGAFWHYYSAVYPTRWGSEWQYGYKELVSEISSYAKASKDKNVYITRDQGRPAMYYWFYSKTDPKSVQAAKESAKKDQGEFLEFENIKFENPPSNPDGQIIAATSKSFYDQYCADLQNKTCKIKKEIYSLDNKIIWMIYELN